MKTIQEFIPTNYFKWENLGEIDITNYPDLFHLLNALKNDYSWVINWIYWQTERVAEMQQIPKSSITSETEIVKQWIWTIIPTLDIDNEEKAIITLPDLSIASLWIRILNMIIKWEKQEDIAKIYRAFEFFKEYDLKNNLQGILKWRFVSQEEWWTIEDFTKIMKVRV